MKCVASRIAGFFLLYACFSPVVALSGQDVRKPSGALRIVVIEGEDAVNVIQQKTAVAPVVEVRDQNGLPVPGAVGTLTGSTLALTFAPPHVETGKTTDRVNSTWVK